MNVDRARIQCAFTPINHFFFVPVTIGQAFLTALLHTTRYRTRRDVFLRLTRGLEQVRDCAAASLRLRGMDLACPAGRQQCRH